MRYLLCGVLLVGSLGCPTPSGGLDGGNPDAGFDAGMAADSGVDGGLDAGVDGGVDAGIVDAGFDAGACDPSSSATLQGCVETGRYQADLVAVTGLRPPGAPHWQQVQDLCAQRLAALGFAVERHVYTTGVNVIGVLDGGDLAAEQVLVSAHYDHLPNCPGADDNASGISGALETARVLSHGKCRRTLVVACWDEEELGLVGSLSYTARARQRSDQITAAFAFEMIGYRNTDAGTQTLPAGLEFVFPTQVAAVHANQDRGDFVVLIGDDLSHQALTRFQAHAQPLGLPTVLLELTSAQKGSAALGQLRRSDHAAFWLQNYPGVMVGDTANFRNAHYHCLGGPDVIADLDPAFSTQIISATVGAAADLLEVR